jgi:hypothetical protein
LIARAIARVLTAQNIQPVKQFCKQSGGYGIAAGAEPHAIDQVLQGLAALAVEQPENDVV